MMAVYVDNARRPFRGMLMAHLVADDAGELHAFAAALGLERSWYHRGHYNVCQATRRRAVRLGAIEVTQRQAAKVRAAGRHHARQCPKCGAAADSEYATTTCGYFHTSNSCPNAEGRAMTFAEAALIVSTDAAVAAVLNKFPGAAIVAVRWSEDPAAVRSAPRAAAVGGSVLKTGSVKC